MYFAIVVLLMFVLPIGSIGAEAYGRHDPTPMVLLAGKWFVFWSVGVRLLTAGVRPFIQPEFTARAIFGIEGEAALPVVRELGAANFAIGVVGVASIVWPSFLTPIAIAAGIFYGIAGLRHAATPRRTIDETAAMAGDLFVCMALTVFVVLGGIG